MRRRSGRPVGELHALGERHGRVVPRRLAVVAVVERAARRRRADAVISAAVSAADSALTPPSSDNSPAKKPLSQVRCSGVNGALSGMSVGIGGGAVWVIRPALLRRTAP